MKILVLTSRFPFPLEKGDKLRAYHQIKWLAKEHEVLLVCTSDERVSADDVDRLKNDLNIEIQLFQLSKVRLLLNLLFGYLFTKNPFQVNYFYQRNIHRKVKGIIRDFNPDHIYCQLVRMSEYVKREYQIPKTIDYMDSLSKSMMRRRSTEKGLKRMLVEIEAKRLRNYETRIFEYFDNKVIISEQDKRFIIHPEKDEIKIIPNGIDVDYFTPKVNEQKFEIVFHGNMSYPPNVEAAKYIVNHILPLLPPHTKLLISGTSPSLEVRSLVGDDVVVSGFVEDVRESYSSAKVFVAPMMIGAGLQNKLLEAMAMAIPCVTTSLANNALKAVHEENILIANSPMEFAGEIKRLMRDASFYNHISTEGRDYVRSHFDWQATSKSLEVLFFS